MIGDTRLGFAPIAGALGENDSARRLLRIDQDVQFQETDAARDIVTLSQITQRRNAAGRLVGLRQQVIQAGTQPTDESNRPPAAYVTLNGQSIESRTAYDTVTVSHSENQNSTASVFVFWPIGATVDIPSFHGKSLQISTHEDTSDASSAVIPLFDGFVETAKYNRSRRGVELICSDLRDNRIGDYTDQMEEVGYYSEYVQRKEVEGKELAVELLRTMTYSVGFGRDGSYYQREWGVSGKIPALTLLDEDVSYDNIQTEFQNRSGVVNRVRIKGDYRYHALHSFTSNIDARRPRIITKNGVDGTVAGYDLETFSSDSMADRANSFDPWETLEYTVASASSVVFANQYSGDPSKPSYAATGIPLKGRSLGFTATIQRRVAQPFTQAYEYELYNDDSIAAYGEQYGSDLSFSVDTEFESDSWEENGYSTGATGKPLEVEKSSRAVYMIGRREILASHRRNYVTTTVFRIEPIDVGQVVEHNNRILTVTGQVSGITYTIADAVRETEIKLSCSYFDGPTAAYDSGSPYAVSTTRFGGSARTLISSSGYNDGILEINAPEIGEFYTNERKPDARGDDQSIVIENQGITLVNGY